MSNSSKRNAHRSNRSRRNRALRCVLCSSLFYYLVLFFSEHFYAEQRLSMLSVQKGELLRMYPQPVQMKAVQDKCAHATLVTSERSIPGALVLGMQMRELRPSCERIVILTVDTINTLDMKNLATLFTRHLFSSYEFIDRSTREAFPYLRGWLAKFELLRLVEYDRIIFFDADVLLFRDCWSISKYKYAAQRTFGFSYVPSTLDGGIYVFTPDFLLWENLVHEMRNVASNNDLREFIFRRIGDADQGVLDFMSRHSGLNITRLYPTYVQLKRVAQLYPNLFRPKCGIHFSTDKPWEPWYKKDVKPHLPLVLYWRQEFVRLCAHHRKISLCESLSRQFLHENRQILRASFLQWLLRTDPLGIRIQSYRPGKIHELRNMEFLTADASEQTFVNTEIIANECQLTATSDVKLQYCVNELSLNPDLRNMCAHGVGRQTIHFDVASPYLCTQAKIGEGMSRVFTDAFIKHLTHTSMKSPERLRPCIYLAAKICTSVSIHMGSSVAHFAKMDLQDLGMLPKNVR